MDAKKKTTSTTTTTRTRTLTDRVTRTLTRDEELVVRMTRGLGEGAGFALEFRGDAHAETAAQLALIEANLLAEMFDEGPVAERTSVDTELKGRILDKLSKLSE